MLDRLATSLFESGRFHGEPEPGYPEDSGPRTTAQDGAATVPAGTADKERDHMTQGFYTPGPSHLGPLPPQQYPPQGYAPPAAPQYQPPAPVPQYQQGMGAAPGGFFQTQDPYVRAEQGPAVPPAPQPGAQQQADTSGFWGGAPSLSFDAQKGYVKGTFRGGRVMSKAISDQTEMGTGKVRTWGDGSPRKQMVLLLQTSERADPQDNGQRQLFIKGDLPRACREAFQAQGTSDIEIGSWVYAAWVDDKAAKTAGHNPSKVYQVVYARPGQPDPMPAPAQVTPAAPQFAQPQPGQVIGQMPMPVQAYPGQGPTAQPQYAAPAAAPEQPQQFAAAQVPADQAAQFAAWQAQQAAAAQPQQFAPQPGGQPIAPGTPQPQAPAAPQGQPPQWSPFA